MKNFLYSIALLVCTAIFTPSFAVEANGLLVNVFKRTVGKQEVKTETYSGTERQISLAVTIKNTSFRKLPEGEMHWTLLIKKGYSKLTEKIKGVEKIKSLQPSETIEITIGPAKVGEYHSRSSYDYTIKGYKDELDHVIIITHEDQETLRTGSEQTIVANAKIEPRIAAGGLAVGQPKPKNEDAPKVDLEKPKPALVEGKPVETKPLIGKEEPPLIEKTPMPAPVVVNTAPPPPPEYSAAKPFDFFNLSPKRK